MESLSAMQLDTKAKINKAKINFKKSPKDRITQSYLETRLESLEQYWKMFTDYHEKIVSTVSKELYEASEYFTNDWFDDTEEIYTDYKSELKEKLLRFSNKCVASVAVGASKVDKCGGVKLPKITIPLFSGKYTEWTSFRDLFESLVHNNTSLDDVQRLHYLKGHLTGEAEQLLRHIPITSCNYSSCWDKLVSRYNNKRYMANCILNRFMSLKAINLESSSALKELLDTTNETLKGLNNLGVNTDNWDILLIFLLCSKLDSESRKHWEAKVSENCQELPTLIQFMDFLEYRFRSLEFLDPKVSKNVTRHQNNISKSFHVTVMPCIYCSDSHKLANCKKFAKEECETRRSFVQTKGLCFNCLGSNHTVYSCRQPTTCRICKKRHHSLLHMKYSPQPTDNEEKRENNVVATTSTQDQSSTLVTTCFANTQSQVLLATALVKVQSRSGSDITLRSLLDQGSQASFVTESAVQLLGLRKYSSKSSISGVGSDKSLSSKYVVFLTIQSLHDPGYVLSVKAHVLSKLTAFLPTEKTVIHLLPQLPDLKLADPKYHTPNKIDILLGAEVYGQILMEGLIKGSAETPVAQNTKLGWILSGKILNDHGTQHKEVFSLHTYVNDDDLLRKFWEIESESSHNNKFLTEEEIRCEEFYEKTTKRDHYGRYIVRLPFRNDDPTCKYGNTKSIAARRFNMLERKLSKNEDLKKRYTEVIEEYINLNHMEDVPKEEELKQDVVYLPHHSVIREDKSTSKVRVVFDGSCSGNNGVSLNQDLMIGPTLQDDLRHIIMRWRKHPVSIVADIIKMYRQIKIAEEDVDFQRLLWRHSPQSEMRHLRLVRVTFGTASAPYLAVRTLQQVARDEKEINLAASERILKDFYMDDLLTGCETIEEGISLCKDISEILKRGGFELQKWSSNDEDLLKHITKGKDQENGSLELKIDTVIKLLGLTWNRTLDVFEYSVTSPPLDAPVTKRKVISNICRLFDPLGWLSPVIIKAKILIQKLWISGIGWDEELPPQLLEEWIKYCSELPCLSGFKLSRWIDTNRDVTNLELHGFCDASTEAYAAVIYLRLIDNDNNVKVHLIASKTKVAPIKQLSVPKLELCGAVLLTRLLLEVSEILEISRENIHAWTDSSVVLAWLSSHPSKWKTFIANRVSEILSSLDRKQWSHVSTKSNPADCASRGLRPSEFIKFEMWSKGPCWLQSTTLNYESKNFETVMEERKAIKECHIATCTKDETCWTKFSSLLRLVRVIAWIRRFHFKIKNKISGGDDLPTWLTSNELNEALKICITHYQEMEFGEEISRLRSKKQLCKRSKLTQLNPFLDECGVLKVGGRLERAPIDDCKKHPIIIPAKSHFTLLLIKEAHERTLHGGSQLMIAYLRSKYWILDLKNQIKAYLRTCFPCLRHSSRTQNQLMGQLPPVRVTPSRPFRHSGVDYAGPISIRTTKCRGYKAHKGYICLFICMVTRAIHLEVASDLTSQGFLAAFKRFVSRRGHCSDLFSDNGTNFVGATRELRTLLAAQSGQGVQEIADWLSNNGTTWHFIPAHAPNFGGIWEAGIKSTKHHLKRVIGTSTLTFEEMSTVLTQIEACLNSRPLSQLSNDTQDILTPGHFLIGEPPMLLPDFNYENSNISSLKRWQLAQRMVQNFWRRWSQEYLTQFLQRYKWSHQISEPNIGDVVLVKEDDLPPSRWLYGVITHKHPGLDNITRVVTLKCKDSFIKRPTSKLCILPVAN